MKTKEKPHKFKGGGLKCELPETRLPYFRMNIGLRSLPTGNRLSDVGYRVPVTVVG